MWRSRQLLYVYLSQYNPQFELVLLLCEDLKEFKSLNSNNPSSYLPNMLQRVTYRKECCGILLGVGQYATHDTWWRGW